MSAPLPQLSADARRAPHRSTGAPNRIALFDLDGTLTWHDTLSGFLAGYVVRRPSRWVRLGQLGPAVAAYLAGNHDRGQLKSRIIRIVMGGDPRRQIDGWADTFVAGLKQRGTFRPAALEVLERHRAAGDRLILLSASPDLYVPRIAELLGFELALCTEIQWYSDPRGEDRLDGSLKTPNCRGEEKVRRLLALRRAYPGAQVVAYGNSASDLAHMVLAESALLVNGSAGARRAAATLGVPVMQWR